MLETKKEGKESAVILNHGRLKQEDNSSCHKNQGDLEEVWLSFLNVVTAIAIVTKFKSHPSHLWKTDFHFHQCDREISHGNLFFLNCQIRLYTMKLKYAALMILSLCQLFQFNFLPCSQYLNSVPTQHLSNIPQNFLSCSEFHFDTEDMTFYIDIVMQRCWNKSVPSQI